MQRTDRLDVQRGGFLQHSLHLGAIFSHDIEIVAGRFRFPLILDVQGTELAEPVCREQHFVFGNIGHHDLRPVYHGSEHKLQVFAAQVQFIAFLHFHLAVFQAVNGEVIGQHPECRGIAHDLHVRILLCQQTDVRRMVGLEVGNNQVIRRPAIQCLFHLCKPFTGLSGIYGIHDYGLVFALHHIRVVSHTIGNGVLGFKQIQVGVVCPDINNIFIDQLFHTTS